MPQTQNGVEKLAILQQLSKLLRLVVALLKGKGMILKMLKNFLNISLLFL